MAHRWYSSRSLVTKTIDHRLFSSTQRLLFGAGGSPIGSPRVGQSALSHPPWFRGGLGAGDRPHGPLPVSIPRQCTPRARLGRPALRRPTCGCSRRDAGRGLTAGHTCQRANAQGLVNCPFLGTAQGDCGRWGGTPERAGGWDQIARGEWETPGNYCTRREMPSFCIRASRVVGLSPRSLAAPLPPLTRQLVSSSILIMCSRPGPYRSGAASRTVTPRPGVG